MGLPAGVNTIEKFQAYDQDRKDLGLGSSATLVLDMSISNQKIILDTNITSITTINNPVIGKSVSYSLFVVQSLDAIYTMDWLASGEFISTLSSAELQPSDTLGLGTEYVITYRDGVFEVLIDKGFDIPAISAEALKVIGRMTNPSQVFQNAIIEYVESEQVALNNNWDKTDEVQAFNVDSEINSLIGWKQFNPSINTGAPLWVLYNGYTFSNANLDSLYAGFIGGDLTNYIQSKVFVTGVFSANLQTQNGLVMVTDSSITYINTRSAAPDINTNINGSSGNYVIYPTNGIYSHKIAVLRTPSLGVNELLLDGISQGQTAKDQNVNPASESFYIGGSSTGGGALDGDIHFFAIGNGMDGFDSITHSAAVRKFSDRMLIQKHITVVNTVLDRYTNLTDREIFALGRLIARSEDRGNWQYIDELYMMGLYDPINALIGMKTKTATITVGTPVHYPGQGYEFLGTEVVASNFIPITDAITMAGGNQHYGAISRPYSIIYDIQYMFRGGNSYGYRLLASSRWGGRTEGVNHLTKNGLATQLNSDMLLDRTPSNSSLGRTWRYGVIGGSTGTGGGTLDSKMISLGARDTGGNPINGILKVLHMGAGLDLLDYTNFRIDINQCVNELEIGKASTVDWDMASHEYEWQSRALAADQLEELSEVILANSDNTTVGRTLSISNNLGITLNAQISLDQLVTNGWVIVQ